MEKNIETISEDTLKCDNEQCDYAIKVPFVECTDWINRPCPKCGENLLTFDDYERAKSAIDMVKFINTLTPEQLKGFVKEIKEAGLVTESNDEISQKIKEIEKENPDGKVLFSVSTHKEIKITNVKQAPPEE